MFLSLSPFKTYNALGACEEASGVEVELKNVLQQLLGCWMFGLIVGIGPQQAKGYQPLQSKKMDSEGDFGFGGAKKGLLLRDHQRRNLLRLRSDGVAELLVWM